MHTDDLPHDADAVTDPVAGQPPAPEDEDDPAAAQPPLRELGDGWVSA